jgi:hypothetical protein
MDAMQARPAREKNTVLSNRLKQRFRVMLVMSIPQQSGAFVDLKAAVCDKTRKASFRSRRNLELFSTHFGPRSLHSARWSCADICVSWNANLMTVIFPSQTFRRST